MKYSRCQYFININISLRLNNGTATFRQKPLENNCLGSLQFRSFLGLCISQFSNCRKAVSNYNSYSFLCKHLSAKSSEMTAINRSNSDVNRTCEMRLTDYDCIGFDLDNTLCEYNILSCVEMEYNILSKYLVNIGYDSNYLLKPLDNISIDFLHKGLLLDFEKGNLLKLGQNGAIIKASHGTKFLSDNEIIEMYGEEKKWQVTNEYCENMLTAWNGPLAEKVRALLDYFDMPTSLAFARIVDSIDYKSGKPSQSYNVWPDILAGLQNMYKRERFLENEGYFKEIKAHPLKYIKKCNPSLIKWLKQLKETKIIYLITGSNSDFASFTAETCLGKDWQSLFDIVVFYARKPGFFSGCRPFVNLNGFEETDPIDGEDLVLGKMYSQGNWQDLSQLFAKEVNKKEPKCLYFGDNLVQDVYTPSECTKCDTVAIVEELAAENINKAHENHPCEELLLSKSWGSYFYDNKHTNTFWGGVIQNYSILCLPTLSVLDQYPLNHAFTTFKQGPRKGYLTSDLSPTEFEKKNIDPV